MISAKIVKSIINEKFDPCEDFYNFACGRFIAHESVEEAVRIFCCFLSILNIDQIFMLS